MFSLFERLLKPTDLPEEAEPPPGFIAFFWHFARQAKGLFVALFAAGFVVALLDSTISRPSRDSRARRTLRQPAQHETGLDADAAPGHALIANFLSHPMGEGKGEGHQNCHAPL